MSENDVRILTQLDELKKYSNNKKCGYIYTYKYKYIGSSRDLEQRHGYHYLNMLLGRLNTKLYNEWKNTINNEWKMEILEKFEDINDDILLTEEQYYIDKYDTVKNGLNMINAVCYLSEKEIRHQYYLKNRENILKKSKEYSKNHPRKYNEKSREYTKQWREKNKDKIKIIEKRGREKNKDKLKERFKNWRIQKVKCECGAIIQKGSFKSHLKAQYHFDKLKWLGLLKREIQIIFNNSDIKNLIYKFLL
jgi:hypothetical protein